MHWKICFSGKAAERGEFLAEFLINRKSRKSEGCLSSFSAGMEARAASAPQGALLLMRSVRSSKALLLLKVTKP